MWKQIRIWILSSWCFLTIGILLGSWWAYHELGWGGWWFWDPVENASLMPWLLATVGIHSIIRVKETWDCKVRIPKESLLLCFAPLIGTNTSSIKYPVSLGPTRNLNRRKPADQPYGRKCRSHGCKIIRETPCSLRSNLTKAALSFGPHFDWNKYSFQSVLRTPHFTTGGPAEPLTSFEPSILKNSREPWTIISIQTTFILSIVGTFFVRSGLLSSVHSFATDSTRGLYLFFFLLCIIIICIASWTSILPHRPMLPKGVATPFLFSPRSTTERLRNLRRAFYLALKKAALSFGPSVSPVVKSSNLRRTGFNNGNGEDCISIFRSLLLLGQGSKTEREVPILQPEWRFRRNGEVRAILQPRDFTTGDFEVRSNEGPTEGFTTGEAIKGPNDFTTMRFDQSYDRENGSFCSTQVPEHRFRRTKARLRVTTADARAQDCDEGAIKKVRSNGGDFKNPVCFQTNHFKLFENFLLLQNFFLCAICLVVFFGTSAPVVFQLVWGRDIGTGSPFYNKTIIPLFTSIFFVLTCAQTLQIKKFNKTYKKQFCFFLFGSILQSTCLNLTVPHFIRAGCKILLLRTPHFTTGGPAEKASGVVRCKIGTLVDLWNLILRILYFPFFRFFNSPMSNLMVVKSFGPSSQASQASLFRILILPAERAFSFVESHTVKIAFYCVFFLIFHFILAVFFLNFNFLESVYIAFCVLNISIVILSNALLEVPSIQYKSFLRNLRHAIATLTSPVVKPPSGIVCKIVGPVVKSSVAFARLAIPSEPPVVKSRGCKNARTSLCCLFSRTSCASLILNTAHSPGCKTAPSRFASAAELPFVANPMDHSITQQIRRCVAPRESSNHYSKREMNISHTGIVLFIIGILLSNRFKFEFSEQNQSAPIGFRLGSQICCLRSIDHSFAPTFHSICANLLIFPEFEPISERTKIFSAKVAQTGSTTENPVNSWTKIQVRQHAGPTILQPEVRSNGGSEGISEGATTKFPSVSLFPEKRFYYSNSFGISIASQTSTKVAIHSNLFTDFYGLVGTGNFETGWFTTIMKLPFIFCIWLGFSFGAVGGLISLKKQTQKYKLYWV